MKRTLYLTLAGALTILLPIGAMAQPYSQSMAQCAGLARALGHWIENAERSALVEHAGMVWATAAETQARSEGVTNSDSYVQDIATTTQNEWLAKGKWAVMSEDFRDWTSYCRKFGNHMGLQLALPG